MNLKNKCILVTKNHPYIASAFQIMWILKNVSENNIILHIHPGCNVFIYLKYMFWTPSCKVFQIGRLWYFHDCWWFLCKEISYYWFGTKMIWNIIMACIKFAFKIPKQQFSVGLTFNPFEGGMGITSVTGGQCASSFFGFFLAVFTRRRIDPNFEWI